MTVGHRAGGERSSERQSTSLVAPSEMFVVKMLNCLGCENKYACKLIGGFERTSLGGSEM